MHRFYYSHTPINPTINLTDPAEIHHLKNVLRLKRGDSLKVFNGRGDEGIGEITKLGALQCTINLQDIQKKTLADISIILACAIPKKGKFETIIEKATELGIAEIIPLQTKRTEVILKDARLLKKMERFERVALNASKQCQRNHIPIIHTVTPFEYAIDLACKNSCVFIPSLMGKRKSLASALPAKEKGLRLSLFIGPEGDFTKEEYAYAFEKGAVPVTLGENILKVETAAIASASFIRLFYGS